MNNLHEFLESKPTASEWSKEELYEGAKLLALSYIECAGHKVVGEFVTEDGYSATVIKESDGDTVLINFRGDYEEGDLTMPFIDTSSEAMSIARKLLLEYLQRNEEEHKARFDVISVLFSPENNARVRHMRSFLEATIE